MNPVRGFTLIELLVVIGIISLLSAIGFVNYRGFSNGQDAINASTQIQSLLRLAQSYATSSTICNGVGSTEWKLTFLNNAAIRLVCNPGSYVQRDYILQNAIVESIIGSGCSGASTIPLTLTFSNRFGAINSDPTLSTCLKSNTWTIKVRSSSDASKTKEFTITKGGAINVQ